ncbi:MAG: SbcC/MukB-like Walker B domain-containing protein, partial [bacterium]
SLLATYDSLRKLIPENKRFMEISIIDAESLLSEKKQARIDFLNKVQSFTEIISRKKDVMSQIESLLSEMASIREVLNGYLAEMESLGVTERDETKFNMEKKEIVLQCEELRREIEHNLRTIERIQVQSAQAKELETRRREIIKEIDEDLIKLYELREGTRDIDCSDAKFASLYERHEMFEKNIYDLTAALRRVDYETKIVEKDLGRATDVRKEIQLLHKDAQAAEENIIKYRELETLFIKTGQDIKRRLVPQVESYFATIIPRITRGRYNKVRLNDDFDISVFSYEKNDYIHLDALSGGTMDQLLISLRLAFAQAATSSTSDHGRFLFLDEPFSSFDESRRELFFQLLQSLKPTFQQIFLISHLPHLEEFVDHYLYVDLNPEKQPVSYSWK